MDSLKEFGNRIAVLRKEQHLKQTELAERAGLVQHQIAEIENGKISMGAENLIRIADALNCQLDLIEKQIITDASTTINSNMADNVADNIKKLGTHLAQLRINNNLTRNDLARIVGKSCAPSIIERCETGTGRPIPILMLIRIANALGWHIDFVEKTAIVS